MNRPVAITEGAERAEEPDVALKAAMAVPSSGGEPDGVACSQERAAEFKERGVHMHRLRSISLLAVSAVLATAGVAYADATPTVTGTVNPGTLSVASTGAAPSFTTTLDGTDQTLNYSAPLIVTDATGSGAGWNLTITSTQFDAGSGHKLATGASSLKSAITEACHTGSTCVDPTDNVSRPVTVPAGATAPTAVSFYNAALATGVGKIDVTPSVDVAVPASTVPGTYTSDLTIAAVSGP